MGANNIPDMRQLRDAMDNDKMVLDTQKIKGSNYTDSNSKFGNMNGGFKNNNSYNGYGRGNCQYAAAKLLQDIFIVIL